MIRCSMLEPLFSRRCNRPADVQMRVEQLLEGVECSFVLARCVDSACVRCYDATLREFQRVGARVTEAKLPYAAVVALKQVSKP
jgi:hypothetical protein